MMQTAVVLFKVAFVVLVLVLMAAVVVALVRFVLLPLARFVRAVYRFTCAPWPAKLKYPRVIWYRLRWHWLVRNLGLAHADPRAPIKHRAPIGPAIGRKVRMERPNRKMLYPRVSFWADAYGIIADVKTRPKVGRLELEQHTTHVADTWRCVRVQVSQRKPGRVTLRGLDHDPLTELLSMAQAPAGVYDFPDLVRPYLGRDEWSRHRWLDLTGITGITVGGLAGYGKTSFIQSLLCQLAPSRAVQFVFIDGRGGRDYGDYEPWHDRAWMHCGDDLADAAGIFEDLHGHMRKRLAAVAPVLGHRNAWHVGPTPEWPLIIAVVDECHTFFDLEAVKGDKNGERHVRTCRSLGAQLVKQQRAALMLTIFITQKQTGDSIPTNIRDNCRIGLSFATRTIDAAVAALGEDIRAYPSYSPTQLLDPAYTGVATASLPTAADPFVRLRVPEITEAAAEDRARVTARLRSDPDAALPTFTPTEPLPA
jgi:S-DNA-T family DNA segregation ATPase FtsK/SpoIIIE